MECRGKFSHKILRKAEFGRQHFDDLLNFRSVEKDKLTAKVLFWDPIACDVTNTDTTGRMSSALSISPNRLGIFGPGSWVMHKV